MFGLGFAFSSRFRARRGGVDCSVSLVFSSQEVLGAFRRRSLRAELSDVRLFFALSRNRILEVVLYLGELVTLNPKPKPKPQT